MWTGDTVTAEGRWRRQHKTEPEEEEWSTVYVPLGT